MTIDEFKALAPGYVAAGAAWLDENEPGWEGRIDLAKLDLSNGCQCVLGQVTPERSYWYFLVRARPDQQTAWHADHDGWAVEHGFNAPYLLRCTRAYIALDELWIALVKERHDSGLLSG